MLSKRGMSNRYSVQAPEDRTYPAGSPGMRRAVKAHERFRFPRGRVEELQEMGSRVFDRLQVRPGLLEHALDHPGIVVTRVPVPFTASMSETTHTISDMHAPISVCTGPGHTEKATAQIPSQQRISANRNQASRTESFVLLVHLAHDKVQRGL
jgi:hypothetical protein